MYMTYVMRNKKVIVVVVVVITLHKENAISTNLCPRETFFSGDV